MRLFRIFALQLMFLVCIFSAAFHSTQADERQPQKWAILVGANDYAHLRDLRYASRDMLTLGTALISNGFSKDHVFVFHDDAKDPRFKPLKANIERQLGLLMQSVEKDDVLLFGFSGHGLSIGGKTYFCPFEARDDNPSGTMLSVEEIAFQLQNIPASSRLIIADACRNNRRSAEIQRLPASRRGTPQGDLSGLGRFLESKADGVAVLWSCAPEQTSYEEDRFQHGVFTYYMLSGLAGYADGNRDGTVSLAELHHFAHRQTKAHVTEIWNADQTPHKFGRSDETWTFLRTGTTAAGVRASTSSPTALPVPRSADPAGGQKKWVTNSVGMTLMLIQEGKFVMGSPVSEVHRAADEPAHVVEITRPFYLGMCEVTQAQYRAVMGANPSWFSSVGGGKAQVPGMDTDFFPVENVSWNDAMEYCRRLSAKEGKTYRLPTEAEWEYACRAGTRTAFYTGNMEPDLSKAGWYGANLIPAGSSSNRTNRVGQKEPNTLGLYDMHGNVWEWCADWYDADYYLGSPAQDPAGPANGVARVIRGGGWLRGPRLCRAAYRGKLAPDDRQYSSGFRVCLPLRSAP